MLHSCTYKKKKINLDAMKLETDCSEGSACNSVANIFPLVWLSFGKALRMSYSSSLAFKCGFPPLVLELQQTFVLHSRLCFFLKTFSRHFTPGTMTTQQVASLLDSPDC